MKVLYKGNRSDTFKLIEFEKYLLNNVNSLWEYKGMKVEIDPIVDLNENNVLIRWTDFEEGFNDKIIYHKLVEFINDFKLINA